MNELGVEKNRAAEERATRAPWKYSLRDLFVLMASQRSFESVDA
jgi:hypothetical protein